jgi:molecular chaperone GrpE
MKEEEKTMTQDIKPQPVAAEPIVAEVAAEPEALPPPSPERLEELEAEVAKLKNDVLYAKAETENVRRRLEQQAEDRGRYAVAQFAKDALGIADNLRRALDAVPPASREGNDLVNSLIQGVEMTERELVTTLGRYGIKLIEAMHTRFDPNLHQAMLEMEDATQPEGTVVLVMQQGYTIHDRLLRPAMVGVSKGGPKVGGGNVDTSV